MQIFIKTLTERTITLEVEQHNTIENIQSKIKDLEKNVYEKYIFLFEGIILEDNKTLQDYNIQNGSIIYVKNNYSVNYYKQFL